MNPDIPKPLPMSGDDFFMIYPLDPQTKIKFMHPTEPKVKTVRVLKGRDVLNAHVTARVDYEGGTLTECSLCDADVPVKQVSSFPALTIVPPQHKHRRNQTLAYHLRIQKKWNKRAKHDPHWRTYTKTVTLSLPSDVAEKLINLAGVNNVGNYNNAQIQINLAAQGRTRS